MCSNVLFCFYNKVKDKQITKLRKYDVIKRHAGYVGLGRSRIQQSGAFGNPSISPFFPGFNAGLIQLATRGRHAGQTRVRTCS